MAVNSFAGTVLMAATHKKRKKNVYSIMYGKIHQLFCTKKKLLRTNSRCIRCMFQKLPYLMRVTIFAVYTHS